MNGRIWSKADLAVLIELYPSCPTELIAQKLRASIGRVHSKANKLGLKKTPEYIARYGRLQKGSEIGKASRFPKGHVPANKGMRRPGWFRGRMRETQFKKGERSGVAALNYVPVGTILPDSDGYLRIKIREAVFGKEPTGWGNPDAWPQLHRHIWKQHHGPIPPGHLVVFRDGNKQNCAIENLELISFADNMRRNSIWKRMPPELIQVIQLNGVLKRKLRESSGQK